jgi:ubiquinone/menaquinone biosynthesis C-methylase UbiE
LGKDLTETIKARYNRISRSYDLMEGIMEWLAFSGWRMRVLDMVTGDRILEVGVGTGKNLRLYPSNKSIAAIDFSAGMLRRARRKAERFEVKVNRMLRTFSLPITPLTQYLPPLSFALYPIL